MLPAACWGTVCLWLHRPCLLYTSGKEMRLFMTDDLVGRGLPMFLPNGYIIWQQLEDYIKGKERERGYLHVCLLYTSRCV